MIDRTNRINEEVKKELSDIIRNELKDPRLGKLISITAVNVTRDFRYARVYVSILGEDEEKKKTLEGLKSAAGFIRREIGHRIKLHYTPEILFELDDSIERGIYMTRLIKDTLREEEKQ